MRTNGVDCVACDNQQFLFSLFGDSFIEFSSLDFSQHCHYNHSSILLFIISYFSNMFSLSRSTLLSNRTSTAIRSISSSSSNVHRFQISKKISPLFIQHDRRLFHSLVNNENSTTRSTLNQTFWSVTARRTFQQYPFPPNSQQHSQFPPQNNPHQHQQQQQFPFPPNQPPQWPQPPYANYPHNYFPPNYSQPPIQPPNDNSNFNFQPNQPNTQPQFDTSWLTKPIPALFPIQSKFKFVVRELALLFGSKALAGFIVGPLFITLASKGSSIDIGDLMISMNEVALGLTTVLYFFSSRKWNQQLPQPNTIKKVKRKFKICLVVLFVEVDINASCFVLLTIIFVVC